VSVSVKGQREETAFLSSLHMLWNPRDQQSRSFASLDSCREWIQTLLILRQKLAEEQVAFRELYEVRREYLVGIRREMPCL
jgi:hypothetical protein